MPEQGRKRKTRLRTFVACFSSFQITNLLSTWRDFQYRSSAFVSTRARSESMRTTSSVHSEDAGCLKRIATFSATTCRDPSMNQATLTEKSEWDTARDTHANDEKDHVPLQESPSPATSRGSQQLLATRQRTLLQAASTSLHDRKIEARFPTATLASNKTISPSAMRKRRKDRKHRNVCSK